MKRIWLLGCAFLCFCITAPNGNSQEASSGSPEGNGGVVGSSNTPTPVPTPTSTPFGQCPDGEKFDFADNRCEKCIYAIKTFRDTLVDDGNGNIYGKEHGIDHMQEATFGPDEVVLGIGNPDNSQAFRDIESYLQNRISYCLTPQPGDDPTSPWARGWNLNFSQCVVYSAFERYHLANRLPNDDWAPVQDPHYAFQFFLPSQQKWHFSDINSIWVKDSNGDLVRRDLPNGATFSSQYGSGMFISYHDALGNHIDPTTILDPRYNNADEIDPTLDPDMWRNHTPKLRDGLDMQVCYEWEVRGVASPVSLFMPDCDYRELEPNIVKFQMNPHDKNPYTVWRGSQCMPLLVYDPTNSGNITSGAQLIGDWTNGGAPTFDGAKKPWKHGFQALSTFDKDGDGLVSGKELGSLSVWTDKNQNGISEEGELASALSFGVKQLRYKSPKNMINGDLFIESGYKLKQGNEVKDGMLVDWYGHTAASEGELVSKLPFNSISKENSPIKKYIRACSDLDTHTLAGGWRWWLDSDQKKTTKGYLVLGQGDDGTLSGNTYSLQPARKKGTKLDLMLGVWPLKAKMDGKNSAVMNIPSVKGVVTSDVKLSEDGMTLKGKTLATSGTGKSQEYSWTAERVGCAIDKKS